MPIANSEIVSEEKEPLPFEMGYLPEEFQEKAVSQLCETTGKKIQCLQEIRELTDLEKTMQGVEIGDDLLLQFVRGQNYDVREAFSQLKNLVQIKRDNMEIFTGLEYEITVKTFIDNIVTYLPFRSSEGCAILHICLDNWIPKEFPVLEIKRMVAVLLLQVFRDPMTQVNGLKVIINAKSNPLRHLRYCTFPNLYLMYYSSQFCIPGKFHSYHLVNMSSTARFCLQMMKTFFSEDLKRKIHIHNSPEELLDYFPAETIPEEYGGRLGKYDLTSWLQKAMEPEELEKLGGKFIN